MTELTPEARAFVDAARSLHDPTPTDLARVRTALGARLGPPPAGSTPPAAAGPAAPGGAVTGVVASTGAKLVGAFLLVGALGAGALWIRSARSESFVRQQSDVTRVAKAPSPSSTSAAPSAAASEAPIVAIDSLPLEPTGSARAAPPASSTAGSDGSLSEEVALIRRARSALQGGDAARAMALLDEHVRRFPRGALIEERRATRVLALCARHETARASAEAGELLRASPHSPHAQRVLGSCAKGGAGVAP